MEKSPDELTDEELIARLRVETNVVRPGYPAEKNAPVDLVDEGVELDQDGVRD